MSYAALAGIAGSLISGGLSAASQSSAGSAAAGAGNAAAAQLQAAGQQANKLLEESKDDALARLEPYRLKLDNLPKLLADVIKGNQAVFPIVKDFSRSLNTFNQNELNRLLGKALPGVKSMVQLASNNTLSMLRGEIPADVAAKARRRSASAALQGGFSGSESADALTARDLGITSLNLMEEGSNSAQRWIQTARQFLMPALTDPTTMLATPQLQISDILAGAGIAKDQAEIVTSTAAREAQTLLQSTGAATQAQLQGAEGQIAGQAGAGKALGQGVEGIFGALGGLFASSGSAPAVGSTNKFGGIYEGSMGGLPVYRPATA